MNTARRVLTKASWPLLDRAVRLAVGLPVAIIVARYLGPDSLGVLSFALAWASFFGGFAWLGLGEAVTRDLVRAPSARDVLVGDVVLLRLAGSLASLVLAVALLPLLYPQESSLVIWLVAITISGSFFIETAGAATIWFVASSRTNLIAATRTVPYLISQAFRLALVFSGASLVWFAAAMPLEGLGIFVLSWLAYRRASKSLPTFSWSNVRALTLLREALPVMLAALVAALALRLDQMMLASLANFREVGIYAGAARLSETWWTIPVALMQVAAPMLLFGNEDAASRRRYLVALYGSLLVVALALATLISTFSEPIIRYTLGSQFEGASTVLQIHAWTSVFVFLDAATYQELIRQRKQSILLYKAIAAIAVNATLNLILIPEYGAVGAASATVVAFAASTLVVSLCFPETRVLLAMQFRGALWVVELARSAVSTLLLRKRDPSI